MWENHDILRTWLQLGLASDFDSQLGSEPVNGRSLTLPFWKEYIFKKGVWFHFWGCMVDNFQAPSFLLSSLLRIWVNRWGGPRASSFLTSRKVQTTPDAACVQSPPSPRCQPVNNLKPKFPGASLCTATASLAEESEPFSLRNHLSVYYVINGLCFPSTSACMSFVLPSINSRADVPSI